MIGRNTDPYWIEVSPHGVCGVCPIIPGRRDVQAFIDEAHKRGHSVERVTAKEAVERHRAFLDQFPSSQPDPAGSSEGER